MANVTVKSLTETKFSSLSLERKLEVKRVGRPTPPLDLTQRLKSKDKEIIRKFNMDVYSRNEWICGCSETNRLFCFPCLLFSVDGEVSWTKTGVVDLGHLSQKIKKHEISKTHMNSELELNLLGKQDIRQQLDNAYRLNIQRHNDQVRKNRYILSKIVDCVKFCGVFELALRGHDETSESQNPGVFRGLVDFSSELDVALRDHLSKATVFKGTSKDIQNDLLSCMLEICHEKIKDEIASADFVSVIADETTDISSIFQLVLVLRYVLPNGNPVERFWGFFTPPDHDAKALSTCLREALMQIVGDPNKVISQSYDGANVMSGRHSGVQTLLREDFRYAHYIHCYAHVLNLILAQATSQNTDVRVFFADLSEIPTFFSHSSQRTAVLNEIVGKKVPRVSNTRWNFKSRTVQVVQENKESLIECLEKIERTTRQTSTIAQARGLRLKLENETFQFWLSVFYLIMPHVDILYEQLQNRNIDPIQLKDAMLGFELAIQKVRDVHIERIEESSQVFSQSAKRRCRESNISKSVAAKEVCDVIISHTKERFQFTNHLLAANLFLSDQFASYEKKFPHVFLQKTLEAYPFIEENKIRTELEILYMRQDFREVSGALALLQFMMRNNLYTTFSQCIKLLRILVTIPMTTAEAERCFSTLKRVKTFLRSTMTEERLTALAMLSIEKEFIGSIQDFNEAVIDKFARRKERRMDFLYKHGQ